MVNEMRLFCRILSTESNDGICLLKRITCTLATVSKIGQFGPIWTNLDLVERQGWKQEAGEKVVAVSG